MPSRREKILALQFKYFGDAVLLTPALRALRECYPEADIHLLVPAEIAPLFEHLPWLTRVWAMSRRRGRANLRETVPLVRALRRERFDRSVDFAGNDRGAILSYLAGAARRLGWAESGGFPGRRFLYTERVAPQAGPMHESVRLARLLGGWGVPPPRSLEAEVRADPALAGAAAKLVPPGRVVVCHVASSQPKKEWPLAHWARLLRLAGAAGHRLAFTTAKGERERSLMSALKALAPEAEIVPLIDELPLFLAVLQRAALFISGDTGPLHFAAGLGVPTVSLFGPSLAAQWAPVGARHRSLTGGACRCDGNWPDCRAPRHCLAEITPEQVFALLQEKLR
jgi:lipopolysaccharide heptosyltransferase III